MASLPRAEQERSSRSIDVGSSQVSSWPPSIDLFCRASVKAPRAYSPQLSLAH